MSSLSPELPKKMTVQQLSAYYESLKNPAPPAVTIAFRAVTKPDKVVKDAAKVAAAQKTMPPTKKADEAQALPKVADKPPLRKPPLTIKIPKEKGTITVSKPTAYSGTSTPSSPSSPSSVPHRSKHMGPMYQLPNSESDQESPTSSSGEESDNEIEVEEADSPSSSPKSQTPASPKSINSKSTQTSVSTPTEIRKAREPIKKALLNENTEEFRSLIQENSEVRKLALVDLLKKDPSNIDVKLLNRLVDLYKADEGTHDKDFVISVFQTLLTEASRKTAKREFVEAVVKFYNEMSKEGHLELLYSSMVAAKEMAKDVKKFQRFVFNEIFKNQKDNVVIKNLKALLSDNYEKLADNKFSRDLVFNKKIIKSEEYLLRIVKRLIKNLDAKIQKNNIENSVNEDYGSYSKDVQFVMSYINDFENAQRISCPQKLTDRLNYLIKKEKKDIEILEMFGLVVEIVEDYGLHSEVIQDFKSQIKSHQNLKIVQTNLLRQKGIDSSATDFSFLGGALIQLTVKINKNSMTKELADAVFNLSIKPGSIFWRYDREVDELNEAAVRVEFRNSGDGYITRLRKKITHLRDKDPVGNKSKIKKLQKLQHDLRKEMNAEIQTALKPVAKELQILEAQEEIQAQKAQIFEQALENIK